MNDADSKVKKQIIDKIKSCTNILVTVSNNPSVDELSAMLGLTAMLNKIGKHATAIFSGVIPPAINFLEPDKVIESTADSLRDFIIALDKEKADHIRYKVEGQFVKIFVTPYRTVINNDDLEFSQGDYNIELVLALGVDNQEHLDTALTAHGQILHDVVIATFSVGSQPNQLGSLDWQDKTASGLSEVATNVCEALKTDKLALDKQIATSLLTGIVAATERFSNSYTSAGTMTIAAQLMAAGADQQLIAAKLQESHAINSLPEETPVVISTEAPVVIDLPPTVEDIVEQSTLPPDNLMINHESNTDDVMIDTSLPQPEVATDNLASTLAPEEIKSSTLDAVSAIPEIISEPSLGGTLNATADQAAEDAMREIESQQNKTILSHSYLSGQGSGAGTFINGDNQKEDAKMIDIFSDDQSSEPDLYSESTLPQPTGTDSVIEPIISAPEMIVQPPAFDLPLPPALPDFSTLPPPITGFDVNPVAPASVPQSIQPTNDPAQFRIPGQ